MFFKNSIVCLPKHALHKNALFKRKRKKNCYTSTPTIKVLNPFLKENEKSTSNKKKKLHFHQMASSVRNSIGDAPNILLGK